MPRNTLVINCDIRETRVALIEGGVIAARLMTRNRPKPAADEEDAQESGA